MDPCLLIRRSISDGERAYFSTWCPAGTSLKTLVAAEVSLSTERDVLPAFSDHSVLREKLSPEGDRGIAQGA